MVPFFYAQTGTTSGTELVINGNHWCINVLQIIILVWQKKSTYLCTVNESSWCIFFCHKVNLKHGFGLFIDRDVELIKVSVIDDLTT